jgi:tripartite-type tricarboxylate transporter receptor subunit TctC
MTTRRKTIGALAAGFGAGIPGLYSGLARAQTGFPFKPVRVVVPFAPGGPTDVIARLLATKLGELWGQPVLVENRPGASANLGIGLVAKATPDGYTILVTSSAFVVNPSLHANLPWDPFRDFVPITNAAMSPNILVVHPSSSAKNLKEFVTLARAQPGKFNFATAGTGTTPHLAVEYLKLAADIKMQHIPYPGAAPAVQAVAANQVHLASVAQPGLPVQLAQAGKVRAIAGTGATRASALPDTPTFIESGFNFTAYNMNGVFMPAGTPMPIVERLHADLIRVLQMTDTRERLAAVGFDPVGNSRDEFAKFVKSEIAQWTKLIRQAGIKVEP